jgi:hypothetical protein
MRSIGPVLASIKPYLQPEAQAQLDTFLLKPKRNELTIVRGARCHSSTLSAGGKVTLMCQMGDKGHPGIDVDYRHEINANDQSANIHVRETWNGKVAIEMRVSRHLVSCRPHEIQGHELGECINLPVALSKLNNLSVKTIEEQSDEMILHLDV